MRFRAGGGCNGAGVGRGVEFRDFCRSDAEGCGANIAGLRESEFWKRGRVERGRWGGTEGFHPTMSAGYRN